MELYLEMKEKGTPFFTDGVFYQVMDATFDGKEFIVLEIEALEVQKLFVDLNNINVMWQEPYKLME